MPAPFAVADLFSKGRLARNRHHCAKRSQRVGQWVFRLARGEILISCSSGDARRSVGHGCRSLREIFRYFQDCASPCKLGVYGMAGRPSPCSVSRVWRCGSRQRDQVHRCGRGARERQGRERPLHPSAGISSATQRRSYVFGQAAAGTMSRGARIPSFGARTIGLGDCSPR